jgi:crotonobetainyl-CoA:carnitine CoA-transferase CaiB-like acyl-CoA transferase
MQYRATGRQPPRRANRDANYCPHGVYPTEGEDEWCAIAVETDEEWEALCALMSRSELARDPRFATRAGRRAREDELDALVSEWTRGQERFALADRLQDAGVAAAAVENLRDMLERDPQLPQHYQQVRQPTAPDAEIPIDGEAIRFSGHPHALERAPMLGEHSERLLCGIVGLSQQEFDQLVLDGVVA